MAQVFLSSVFVVLSGFEVSAGYEHFVGDYDGPDKAKKQEMEFFHPFKILNGQEEYVYDSGFPSHQPTTVFSPKFCCCSTG